MKNYLRTLLPALLVLIFFSTNISAQPDRLLPASALNGLLVEWRQDGQVIEYVVHNRVATWSITEISLNVDFKPNAVPTQAATSTAGQNKKSAQPGNDAASEKNWNWAAYMAFMNSPKPEVHVIALPIAPSGSVAAHLELKSSASVVAVQVTSARGREPTVLENMRNMLR